MVDVVVGGGTEGAEVQASGWAVVAGELVT